ncbi:hypothetical protein K8T06_16720 [bacterium]|nr:hypothetical protein [bacterium]
MTYQDAVEEDLIIEFQESRARKYKLIIDDGDNPPIKVLGVSGQGNVYQLVYLARGGSAYQVFWGADKISKPIHDTAAITALLNDGYAMKRARIGRGFANPDQGVDEKNTGSNFLNSNWFFGLVVVFMILVLGSALMKAVRKQG